MRVQCGETTLTATLTTAEPFEGRMYASGHGDNCGVDGVGSNVTVLRLPLPRKEDVGAPDNIACGLTPAYSIDNENRYANASRASRRGGGRSLVPSATYPSYS